MKRVMEAKVECPNCKHPFKVRLRDKTISPKQADTMMREMEKLMEDLDRRFKKIFEPFWK